MNKKKNVNKNIYFSLYDSRDLKVDGDGSVMIHVIDEPATSSSTKKRLSKRLSFHLLFNALVDANRLIKVFSFKAFIKDF